MFFADKLELGKPRRTKEGYLAVRAKAARAGVYDYLGREVDPEGKHFAADQVVKVYRPEAEVFAKPSVHSFLLKPITDDHPHEAVTADNWKQYAKGVNAGALRDGDHLAFDLVVMDAAAIKAIDDGKKELSNGYACSVDIGDGVAPDGTAYQATQREIFGNHIALVAKGRAGPECSIGDAATCDAMPRDTFADLLAKLLTDLFTDERTYNDTGGGGNNDPARRETSKSQAGDARPDGEVRMAHVLVIDGLQVPNVSDEAKAAIEKLQGQITALTADKSAADTKVGELTATVSTKDGEIAALNQKIKDAEVSPAKLEQLAADRAKLVATVKAVDASIITDGKSDAEIRKALVEAKLGDGAKDLDDAAIGGAFKVLTKDVKPAETVDALRSAIASQPVNAKDAAAKEAEAYDAANDHNSWRKQA